MLAKRPRLRPPLARRVDAPVSKSAATSAIHREARWEGAEAGDGEGISLFLGYSAHEIKKVGKKR